MGFDCYGINPTNPNGLEKPEIDWSNKPNEDDRSKYFEKLNSFEEEIVGSYFRNNVWWWRPLWGFVCTSCDDFLSDDDMEKGQYNDGKLISKTKSKKIASRIRKLDKEGILDKYQEDIMKIVSNAEVHNKKVNKRRTALINRAKAKFGDDIIPANYPEPYKSEWKKIQDDEDWSGHYPFDADNIREFGKFCESSGGFEIC